ncbi:MAG: hydroxyacid dehydrogenase [Muribaculaceae bacterium]|nr:hydroxyacid dehydrogenase [Muribaculaceae bacterium]
MKKVYIPRDVNACGKDWLRERGYELVMGTASDEETMIREIRDADAILARTAPYTRRVIESGKKLKVIARFGVGYETVDVQAATDNGVYVTITKNCNMQAVAEHTMGLYLALAKQIYAKMDACRAGNWKIRDEMPGVELGGKVLGIIGYGSIGRVLAERVHYGLCMQILCYDPYADCASLPGYVRMTDLETLLRQSDIVSVHVPRTPETEYMINADTLGMMKKTAFLVNCGRGRLVDEDALYTALKNGTIAAAALDVFENEPVNPNLPLLELDNFLASPHCAGLTAETGDAQCLCAAQSIDDVLTGKKPLYPVNEI